MKNGIRLLLMVGSIALITAVLVGAASFVTPVQAAFTAINAPYSPTGPGEIQGTIFRDFDADATQDAIEPGIAGVTVTAYTVSGTVAATAITAADGSYTLSGLTDGNAYRIEITGYPSFLFPAPVGTGNHTTASFATSPATGIDVALLNPADYSQQTPDISGATYFTGDPMVTGTPANAQALVSYPYTRTGLCQSCGGVEPDPTVLAKTGDVGSVWGVAYQRSAHTLYASAFLKRHAGLYEDSNGDPKLGMIFKVDLSANTVAPWVDLATLGASVGSIPDNTSRGLQGNINPSTDADAYAKIGKVGLGDIDISDDESTLWVMSLNDRKLYSLDIANPTSITGYPVPDPGCTNGEYRPFAVKYHDGDIYIGEVCDASATGGTAADLHAYIYKLPNNGAGAFQPVYDFALNYSKGLAWEDGPGTCNTISGWYPWQDSYPAPCNVNTSNGQTRYVYPMPILSDIEFDYDGSMVLGFIDRLGHQIGDKNANDLVDPPEGTAAAVVGGDVLRVCNTASGFALEGSTSCPSNDSNNQGPGGGEFYYQDELVGASHHLETTNGGLAVNWQQNQVVVTAMDPYAVDTVTGGTNRFNNTTGAAETGYAIYHSRDGSGNNTGTFAKANGMGDVELLANPAPLEVGGSLWADLGDSSGVGFNNGVYDPGEDSIPNATVSLVCDINDDGFGGADDVTASTTADANGNYYFKDGDASLSAFPTASWDNTLHIIPRHTDCRILVNPTQSAITSAMGSYGTPTKANNGGSDPGADLRDSDGTPNLDDNGKVGIAITTGGSGQSDHSADFGFIRVDWGDLPTSYKTVAADNGPYHILKDADSNGQPDLFLGTAVDGDSDGFVDGIDDTNNATDDDQPSGTGSGNGDDEDGISAFTPLVPNDQACVTVSATNNTGSDAFLYAWMDFNGDGHFTTSEILDNGTVGDYQFSGGKATVPAGGVSNKSYCFQVPNGSTFNGGKAAMRFRLTTDALTTSDWVGAASDGEVEDYLINLARISPYVWNDGTGSVSNIQDSSDTNLQGITMRYVWAGPNNTIDTTPSDASAQGDDWLYTRNTGSNGMSTAIGFIPGQYQLQIATPPASAPGIVASGRGTDTDKDSNASQPGGPGTAAVANLTIPDPISLSTGEDGNSDNPGAFNNFPDEQDELSVDFGFVPVDWGDLPDSYATDKTDNSGEGVGPYHGVHSSLSLGATIDSEADGQPSSDASGDGSDEDGISNITPLAPNAQACVTVNAINSTGTDANLYAWIDFNGDGHFAASEALDNGSDGDYQFTGGKATVPNNGVTDKTYCFLVPNGSTFQGGKAAMRFRLTTDTLTTSDFVGGASDGEVEDYLRTVARVSTYLWNDETGTTPGMQDPSDTGLSGVQVRYVWAGIDNTIDTTPEDGAAQNDDKTYLRTSTSTGVNTIIGLTPGHYELQILNPPTTVPEAIPANQGADPYKDSDGSQPEGPGEPVVITLTIPDPIALSTGENGNEDNPGALYSYSDSQDELSFDQGFKNNTKVAIGNIVWHDTNGNAVKDGSESGIGNVTVKLYQDADGDGVCEPGSDTEIQTQSTKSDGSYDFTNLPPSNATDPTTFYCVAVVKADVSAAGYDYSSAGGGQQPDTAGDQNDDGIPSGSYVVTKPFAATENGQPDTGDSGDPAAYPDDSSYMTVDFGFLSQTDYDAMSSPNAVVLQTQTAEQHWQLELTALLALSMLGISLLLWLQKSLQL